MFFFYMEITGASPGFGRGGVKNFILQIWEFACREAMRIAIGGFGGMLPRENF